MTVLPQIGRELARAARRTAPTPPRRSRRVRRALIAAAVVIAAVVVVLATVGRGSHGDNVASAALRAVSRDAGILHTVIDIKPTYMNGGSGSGPARLEEWSARNPDQLHTIQVEGGLTLEQAVDGHRISEWTSGRPDEIRTYRAHRVIGRPPDATSELRSLLGTPGVRVTGRGRVDGRPAIRLSVPVRADLPPNTTGRWPNSIVWVDARTHLPIETIAYTGAGARDGHLFLIRRTVTHYRVFERLPDTSANRKLLTITDHPAAHIRQTAG